MPDSNSFSPANTLALYNPTSGRGEAQQRAGILVQHLLSAGYHVVQTHTISRDETCLSRVGSDWQSLICIGGDGTLFQAITKISSSAAIAFYPSGTINLFARSLSLPCSVDAWLHMLCEGVTRDVYFGLANGRSFVSVGSVGFDARVVARVSLRLKSWIHEGAYGVQAIRELLRYNFPPCNVFIDGRKIEGKILGVIVGKGPYFAGRHPILPAASQSIPRLSVAVLHGERRRCLVRYAYGLVRGHLGQMDGVKMYSAEQVVVEGSGETDVELDGEPFGFTPVTFTVEPVPRKVLAP
ncbi:MAG: diacylglycerol kinase [Nitrospirales bacterium]|nr:MAG: diacylglycerol kinase [Nitrospirales bacterium]